ncbi:hypothetical protein PR048_033418 [Dryococelus australis]|uniref:CST complex subunit CTC1 n=1 Tax=Dryococelus australis TaxID=614101 RepID=A0ABQ9G093_9NEOP|nr:hypothetical protein PR048_033418 [Dryococelus australis]
MSLCQCWSNLSRGMLSVSLWHGNKAMKWIKWSDDLLRLNRCELGIMLMFLTECACCGWVMRTCSNLPVTLRRISKSTSLLSLSTSPDCTARSSTWLTASLCGALCGNPSATWNGTKHCFAMCRNVRLLASLEVSFPALMGVKRCADEAVTESNMWVNGKIVRKSGSQQQCPPCFLHVKVQISRKFMQREHSQHELVRTEHSHFVSAIVNLSDGVDEFWVERQGDKCNDRTCIARCHNDAEQPCGRRWGLIPLAGFTVQQQMQNTALSISQSELCCRTSVKYVGFVTLNSDGGVDSRSHRSSNDTILLLDSSWLAAIVLAFHQHELVSILGSVTSRFLYVGIVLDVAAAAPFSADVQDCLPLKVKQFVKVPNTYQNMFSISHGSFSRWLRECLCENAIGNMASSHRWHLTLTGKCTLSKAIRRAQLTVNELYECAGQLKWADDGEWRVLPGQRGRGSGDECGTVDGVSGGQCEPFQVGGGDVEASQANVGSVGHQLRNDATRLPTPTLAFHCWGCWFDIRPLRMRNFQTEILCGECGGHCHGIVSCGCSDFLVHLHSTATSSPFHVKSSIHFAGGATVAEQLACSPPTKSIRGQSPAGSLRIFACGNRAGRCHWLAGLLWDLLYPPLFHFGASPYSPPSSSLALKTSMLRVIQISSLTHSICWIRTTGHENSPVYDVVGLFTDRHNEAVAIEAPAQLVWEEEHISCEAVVTPRCQHPAGILSSRVQRVCAQHQRRLSGGVTLVALQGQGGVVARLFASHLSDFNLIPGGITPGGNCLGDAAHWQSLGSPVSPTLSFHPCSILTSLHPYLLSRPGC